ncbi:leucine-rich_repeat domain-containing protein [Hexamita inflata]|uniref:Leucine-rich repeat domain-containing protein n=1 Tax=Hexamita inflata TaxID=28002 RepID=A0AA86P5I1_9EUKA|nr:leucine-rich repeat domain-containing protein [Hexamita inflata]
MLKQWRNLNSNITVSHGDSPNYLVYTQPRNSPVQFQKIQLKQLQLENINDLQTSDVCDAISVSSLILKLSSSRFTFDGIFKFINLTDLKIIRQPQVQISFDTLSKFTTLHTLILNDCNIEQLDFMKNFSSLRILNVSHNEIRTVMHIFKLKQLQDLNIGYNQLENVQGLENCVELITLNIEFNKIQTLEPLKDLRKLKELRANSNQLHYITVISNFEELTFLDLSDNKNALIQLKNKNIKKLLLNNTIISSNISNIPVQELWVNNCNLNSLQSIVQQNLRELHISNNNISRDSLQTLKALKRLKKLYCSNNPIIEYQHELSTCKTQIFTEDDQPYPQEIITTAEQYQNAEIHVLQKQVKLMQAQINDLVRMNVDLQQEMQKRVQKESELMRLVKNLNIELQQKK